VVGLLTLHNLKEIPRPHGRRPLQPSHDTLEKLKQHRSQRRIVDRMEKMGRMELIKCLSCWETTSSECFRGAYSEISSNSAA